MPPIRRHRSYFPRFSLEDYLRNPEAVKRVNDALLEYLQELQEEKENSEDLSREREIELIDLKHHIQKVDDFNAIQSLLFVVGAALFGFGVNLATSSPHDWPGWVLAFAGSGLQTLVIFMGARARLRRHR